MEDTASWRDAAQAGGGGAGTVKATEVGWVATEAEAGVREAGGKEAEGMACRGER